MKEHFKTALAVLQAIILTVAFGALAAVYAQQTTGNVRGIVKDPTGAVVPGAQVTLTSKATAAVATAQTTGEGEYQFNNLLPGDYTISVEAANFKTLTLNDVRVELNQTTDVPTQLQVGLQGEVVEVSAGGAELIDTTTTTLSKSFDERQVVDLAVTNVGGAFGGGVNNLALLAPNVSTSGGVGVGTGGSVGGQRPRNNNFMLDGVDNNRKDVTGPTVYVSPENVAEFSLLQNQFSAEFARSNGGQFITVTKSGTNDFHGSAYGFFRNRYLNALDTLDKLEGVVRERDQVTDARPFFPRSDFFRGGANLGGPVYFPRFGEGGPAYLSGRDKLFFYTSYERLQLGSAAGAGGITAPTAAGFALINSFPGLSATNLDIFNRFVPVAPAQTRTIGFCRVARAGTACLDPNPGTTENENLVAVPVGRVDVPSPNFTKQNHFLLNMDYNQSSRTQHRFRFNFTNTADVDTEANLPQFFIAAPIKGRIFSYTLLHNFSPNVINETRIAYRRYSQPLPVPTDITFPGLGGVFPNLIFNDLALNVGPNGNAPQTYTENNYQIVNNVTYLAGAHSFKFGGDFRRLISPQSFVQRERGDYQYSSIDTYLRDISPNVFGQRTVGASPYYGDQHVLFAFAQDDWRASNNLTLNLGLSYSYQEVPKGANLQSLNALASVPGLIEFREPQEQKWNFGPRVGLAYSPNFTSGLLGRAFGESGKSSIRAGFSMAYDYIFDNVYVLALPPQANQTVDVDPRAATPGFLAGGGIPSTPVAVGNDPVAARAATSAFIPDQEVPYSLSWTLSFQRQFLKDYSLELRYLGTRGIHLLTQNRLNSRSVVTAERNLPTFFTTPSQAQINGLGLTLADLEAESPLVPRYENAGFDGNFVVGFLSNGNSTYHGASAQLLRRFSRGFQMSASYTWSHLIDDTTAEVFSTVLSPRRVQDFQNLRAERADSALDRRHRFVLGAVYDLPFLRDNNNRFVRTVLGGWSFAGVYSAESGQKATVLSGLDSNLNFDAAPDRTIRNVNGTRNTSSTVTPLLRTCTVFVSGDCDTPDSERIVGYVADNPNAEYIQAGAGAFATSARNTLQLPGINNLDFSIFKNFYVGETRKFQLRADLFNAFNRAQYIPGSPNDVVPVDSVAVGDVNTVGRADFNRPGNVFSSNPRVIQLSARFDF